jgi:hypothetical protein
VEGNLSTRSMHHHVFDTRAAWGMLVEAGWSPQVTEARWPHDIVVLARNGGPVGDLVPFRSPFPTDRRSRRAASSGGREHPDLSVTDRLGRD